VRERKRREVALLEERGKKDFLDPQRIPLAPSESLNTGPSDLFPSHSCGASEWQGTLASESIFTLRANLFHPSTRVF
jgi:hypothetical protein